MSEQINRPKKVLIFSLVYYPKYGEGSGAEPAVKEITDRISPDEIEFHMVTLRYDSNLPKVSQEGNVLVHRIGFARPGTEVVDFDTGILRLNKYLFQFMAAWKAHRLHKRYHYDGIWALMAHSTGVPAALFKIFHPKVKYLLTLQEGDPKEHVERVARPVWPLFTRAFTKADIVQAISQYLADWARERHFTGPLEIIRNGANPKNFKQFYSDEELQEVRRSLGKKDDDVYLFIAARMVQQKAMDVVIKALAQLPANVHFCIASQGGDDEEMLHSLVVELKLENRVHFLGSFARDDVPKYRNPIVMDIFVHPSRSEGLGNTVLSAMAGRLPVIATQVGGFKDTVFDEERDPDKKPTAWAVDPDSPEQIAKAVQDIMDNPDKVKRITDNARAMIEEDYNWDNVARQMQERVFSKLFLS